LIVSSSRTLQGMNPLDGKTVWSARIGAAYASPVCNRDVVFNGYGMALRLDPDSVGDIKKNAWRIGASSDFNSPVVYGGYLYTLGNGRIQVCDTVTGNSVFSLPLTGATSYASPVITADGLLYAASAGKSYVFTAEKLPRLVSVNDLQDDNHASCAVSGGRIYLRGRKKLWCVGSQRQ